jgi:hypothetical protein
VAAASPAAGQRDCEHEATRSATLRASTGDVLHLIARAGSLTVRGREGLTEVRVMGRACASSEALLEQLRLETDRSGSTIRVEVPDIEGGSWLSGNRYHALHLEIEVPKGMAARIEDGSGEIVLEGLGPLDLNDGSGSIEITDIDGDIVIDDGSGGITVRGVDGSIGVNDGSGSISIRDVEGTVDIGDDGSGSIDVRNVAGDFIVGDDGSGGITYDNVSGRVDIPRRDRRRRQRR